MATADTIELDEPHAPREAALALYSEIEHELKRTLLHKRHDSAKHELPYFEAAAHLSDTDFVSFTQADLDAVRHGRTAYGHFVLGRVKIPALAESKNCYIHFRAFEKTPETDEKARLHCIRTDKDEEPDGGSKYRALFTEDDPLKWTDT